MPCFGRAQECKEYEHRSEKKVRIVSGIKWNKRDPQRDTSKTQTCLSQRKNKRGFKILREKWISQSASEVVLKI